jgi:hypothetical protein
MNKDEIFTLAIEKHKIGKLEIAKKFYNDVLKIDPSHEQTHKNVWESIQKQKTVFKKQFKLIKILQMHILTLVLSCKN